MLILVVHLALAGVWLGSMAYSLVVVQPRVDRYCTDPVRREELLVTLANGNRRPVLVLIAGLLGTGVAALLVRPEARLGYALALGLYLPATALFWYVSWRHWPARVFALPDELPGYQRRLRRLAWAMAGLVGAAFVSALVASVRG